MALRLPKPHDHVPGDRLLQKELTPLSLCDHSLWPGGAAVQSLFELSGAEGRLMAKSFSFGGTVFMHRAGKARGGRMHAHSPSGHSQLPPQAEGPPSTICRPFHWYEFCKQPF